MKINDKIIAVLDKLKEEWDITPKEDSFSDDDIYRHHRKAREAYVRYIIWLNELPVDYFQLDSVLALLQQEKFIEHFKFGEEVLTINFPADFEEKYNTCRKLSEQKNNNHQLQLEALKRQLDEGLKEEKFKKEVKEEIIKDFQNSKEKTSQSSDDVFSIQLKKQIQLEINKNTGDVSLGKTKSKLNPESQEFKALLKLITSKDYIATYKDLLGDNPTKTNKRNLSFVIRNIKEVLNILPRKNAKNRDIIKNMKNYGYSIIT